MVRVTAYLEALPGYLKERGVEVRKLARSLECSIGDIEALSVSEHPQARFCVFLEVLRSLGDELEGIEDATVTGVLEHIERIRVRTKMSVKDVARLAGLHRTHYPELMRKPNRNPKLHTVLRLAAAVDCELTVRPRRSVHQFGATCDTPRDGTAPPQPSASRSSGAESTATPRFADPQPGAPGAAAPTPPRPEPARAPAHPPVADEVRSSFLHMRRHYGTDEIDDGWMNEDPDLEADLEAQAEEFAARMFGSHPATSSHSAPAASGAPAAPPLTNPSAADPAPPPSDPRRGALRFQEMLDARINGTQVSAPTGAFSLHVSYEKFAVPPLNLPVDGTGRDTLECSTRLVPDPSEPPKKR